MTRKTITIAQLIKEIGIQEYKKIPLKEIAQRIGKIKEYKIAIRLLWASLGAFIVGAAIIVFANLFLTNVTVKTIYWEICIVGGAIITAGVFSFIIDLIYGKKHFPSNMFLSRNFAQPSYEYHLQREEGFEDYARRVMRQPLH